MDTLRMAFLSKKKEELRVFAVMAKDLRQFAATEKDAKKDISRVPGLQYLLKEKPTKGVKESIATSSSGQNHVWEEYEIYKSSERGSIVISDFDFDINLDEDEVRKSFSSSRASTIYKRGDSYAAELEDFVIKKIIGKGAFGKVFLVENKNVPGDIFAMKSIRKDKIIDF